MARTWAAAAIITVIIALPHHAAGLSLDVDADLDGTVTHSFTGSSTKFVRDTLGVDAPGFTVDLGGLDGISAHLEVGPHKRIDVDLPAGKTGFLEIMLDYDGTLGVFNMDETWSSTQQVLGVVGSPGLTEAVVEMRGRENGNEVVIRTVYTFTAPFSFTGWHADITGPFSSGGNMTYASTLAFMQLRFQDTVDGGQFVSIVPEPGGMAMMAVGAAMLLGRRRTT